MMAANVLAAAPPWRTPRPRVVDRVFSRVDLMKILLVVDGMMPPAVGRGMRRREARAALAVSGPSRRRNASARGCPLLLVVRGDP
jgi:hypothetical protein